MPSVAHILDVSVGVYLMYGLNVTPTSEEEVEIAGVGDFGQSLLICRED